MPEILVVDDSELDRQILKQVFRVLGDWNAEYVADGATALSMLKERRFDLVLADVLMPVMDGLELLESIGECPYHVPVVVMTSKGNEEQAIDALRLGAANYIVKQKMVEELPSIVRAVLRSAKSSQLESQLLAHLCQSDFQFEIPNDRNLVHGAIGFIQNAAEQFGRLSKREHLAGSILGALDAI